MLIDIAGSIGPTIHPAMAPIVERLKGLPAHSYVPVGWLAGGPLQPSLAAQSAIH